MAEIEAVPDGEQKIMNLLPLSSWQPTNYRRAIELIKDLDTILIGLLGNSLEDVWVVWDPDEDTWYSEKPIILCFTEYQVEISGHGDDIRFSIDSIDTLIAPEPLLIWDEPNNVTEIEVFWRRNPPIVSSKWLNQCLLCVCVSEDQNGIIQVEFVFDIDNALNTLIVFNAGDKTGIRFAEVVSPDLDNKSNCNC